MPAKPRTILIALGQDDGQERSVLAGLYARVQRRAEWAAYVVDPARLSAERVAAGGFDAVVGRIEPRLADRLAATLPVISTLGGRFEKAYSVVTDDAAIGRSAAKYFLDRSFEHFAYVGSGRPSSTERRAAFAAVLRGRQVHAYLGPDTGATQWNPKPVDARLAEWVHCLPMPVAVLAENDLVAFRVSEICRHERIAIPDQLSLLGVGNDELMCRLCHPSLTTIATPTDKIGLTVANLLNDLFARRRPKTRTVTLPHAGIVERQSANLIRTDDNEVAGALRYIRTNAHKTISIEDIVAAVPTSRRTLERRFRGVMGQSLQAAVTQARVERAKSLLAYSRSSIGAVAQLSGFSSTQRFHIVFRRAVGTTPQAYRQQFQNARPQIAG